MGKIRHASGWLSAIGLAFLSLAAAPANDVVFTDVTQALKIDFKDENSATSNKYLVETMGGGVALFDYDNTVGSTFSSSTARRSKTPCLNGRCPTNRIANSGIGSITKMRTVRLAM